MSSVSSLALCVHRSSQESSDNRGEETYLCRFCVLSLRALPKICLYAFYCCVCTRCHHHLEPAQRTRRRLATEESMPRERQHTKRHAVTFPDIFFSPAVLLEDSFYLQMLNTVCLSNLTASSAPSHQQLTWLFFSLPPTDYLFSIKGVHPAGDWIHSWQPQL